MVTSENPGRAIRHWAIPGADPLTPTCMRAFSEPVVAVIRAMPGAIARIMPNASTVAVDGASLRHMTDGLATNCPALSRAINAMPRC